MDQDTSGLNLTSDEWYMRNPLLQGGEITEMLRNYPDAKMGLLSDGKMYWIIKISVDIYDAQKEWTLLIVYNSDYPQQQWYGSIKVYPVKPNYYEMVQMVNHSLITPKIIPHIIRDENGSEYLAVKNRNYLYEIPDIIYHSKSAKAFVDMARLYIKNFELALTNQQLWSRWTMVGNPNGGKSI